MTATDERHELIVYATPRGPLLEACERYFAEVSQRLGPTTAQTYPPHVTLTGFFHRTTARRDEMIAEVGDLLRRWGAVPAHAVAIDGLTVSDEWIGLPVSSRWLIELTADLIGHHAIGDGDDPLRPKDWLHLSLAYGDHGTRSLASYGTMAVAMVDPALSVTWDVGLWERSDAPDRPRWQRHA